MVVKKRRETEDTKSGCNEFETLKNEFFYRLIFNSDECKKGQPRVAERQMIMRKGNGEITYKKVTL